MLPNIIVIIKVSKFLATKIITFCFSFYKKEYFNRVIIPDISPEHYTHFFRSW